MATPRVHDTRDRRRPPGPPSSRRERHREPAAPDRPAEPPPDDPTTHLPRALKAIGSVVAPASLITGLMFYFGVNHAAHFFQWFGVNYTVMGLTTQDFLIRSVDGLFLPLVIIAAAVLVMLWTLRLGSGRLSEAAVRDLRRRVVFVSVVLGVLGIKLAIAGVIRPEAFQRVHGLPGLCLAAGVLLLTLASHLHRATPSAGTRPPPPWAGVTEWGAVFVVVSVGLFWAVTDYSAAVGQTRGFNTEQQLAAAPGAVLYSKDRLSIPAMSTHEVVCAQPEGTEGAYRYRYENLTLVFASADQYLLLPSGWPGEGGIAIVLPRSDSLRLEFVRSGLEQGATC